MDCICVKLFSVEAEIESVSVERNRRSGRDEVRASARGPIFRISHSK
jgi:hypothetical protein